MNFPLSTSILLLSAATALADFTGKVIAVSDGDTIAVLTNATAAATVRLSGIDCPEKAQPFGQRAKQATSELAFGQTVTVKPLDKDRYGRTIGEVTLPDGRNLSRELVRLGMAWWYKEYAPKDTTLKALEAAARTTKAGLWSDPKPIPPWLWRKQPKPTDP